MIKAEKLKDFDPKKFGPGYMSEKHNGIHGTFNPQNRKIYSRTPNIIHGLEHIEKGLQIMFPNMYINGEIVIPDMEFEEASGKIRSHNPTPEAEFYIFNCLYGDEAFDAQFPFVQRFKHMRTKYLQADYEVKKEAKIHLVDFVSVISLNHFFEFFDYKVEVDGAEGICWIANNHINAPGMRRWNWMKHVPYKDKEVTIIDIAPGTKGKKYENSLGAFVCEDENHKVFRVGIFKGQTDEWRQNIYENADNYIGERITVQYKNLSKRGVPYQPRFKAFRWDI